MLKEYLARKGALQTSKIQPPPHSPQSHKPEQYEIKIILMLLLRNF